MAGQASRYGNQHLVLPIECPYSMADSLHGLLGRSIRASSTTLLTKYNRPLPAIPPPPTCFQHSLGPARGSHSLVIHRHHQRQSDHPCTLLVRRTIRQQCQRRRRGSRSTNPNVRSIFATAAAAATAVGWPAKYQSYGHVAIAVRLAIPTAIRE